MSQHEPVTVFCHYRVRATEEPAFRELLGRHWPTLQRLGVVTDDPSAVYRGVDEKGRPFFFEVFSWRNEAAFERAHAHPEVLAIWEPMDTLCEAREGRPNMEFPHVRRLTV
jgi:hypothetical protein